VAITTKYLNRMMSEWKVASDNLPLLGSGDG
jgi:hypothetical protein